MSKKDKRSVYDICIVKPEGQERQDKDRGIYAIPSLEREKKNEWRI